MVDYLDLHTWNDDMQSRFVVIDRLARECFVELENPFSEAKSETAQALANEYAKDRFKERMKESGVTDHEFAVWAVSKLPDLAGVSQKSVVPGEIA